MHAHRPVAATPAVPPHDLTAEGRRERHRKETFERLVRAARTIMFSRGLSDVTVQEITDAADVGKGTFFNYFPSKGHVFSRVAEFNRRGLVRTLERVRDGERSSEDGLLDLLVWIMCPSAGAWLTYESNTVQALVAQPEVRRGFSEQMRASLPLFEELMSLGQERGTIRRDLPSADLATMAHYFVAGSQILHWIHNLAPTPESMSEQVKQYFTLLKPPAVTPVAQAAGRKARRKPRTGSRRVAKRRRP